MDINSTLAKRLKYYMEKLDINNSELAEKIGVSAALVGQWRNEKHSPRMDKVDKLCDVFGCTRSDLLDPNSEPGLSEYVLIEVYEKLNKDNKQLLIDYAMFLKERNDEKEKNNEE